MDNLKLEDIEIKISPHKNGNSDYCIMTLHAKVNKKPCKESIAVYSKFLFEEADDEYRLKLIDDIIYKLTYDMIIKSYVGIDTIVKDKVNKNIVANKIKKLYKNNLS